MKRIVFHESTKTFHLQNDQISYIFCVLRNGVLGQLYFGKRLKDKADFAHLVEANEYGMTCHVYEDDPRYSMEHIRQEYPVYGTTDFRQPAIEVLQENGSRISQFVYEGHEIKAGKPKLEALPATYVEDEGEADTLTVYVRDAVTGIRIALLYSIYDGYSAIIRSARIINEGKEPVHLQTVMSLSIDLPDKDYNWLQLSGAWSRERHVKIRPLEQGITAIGSMKGHSSPNHNPFVALLRPNTTETAGEVVGLNLVYSGNFRIQAEVDTYDVTRFSAGINPEWFDWYLPAGESFQTPEAVLVYSDTGLNGMSQTYHKLYQTRLVRGIWRDRSRPILNNNWEATYFDFTEDRLVEIASKAKECGVELFVLDDGWFGKRRSDHAGLGDWWAAPEVLPNGLAGLSERIRALGMDFGVWIEPEMVNPDSDLYRAHPDWVLHVPGRAQSYGRYQYVLDFSRKEIVDYIHGLLKQAFTGAHISYVKWDMNRSLTECYSVALPPERQGEVFHRHILGVYDLYERLRTDFPEILFESCASGGGRFDAGMLYYAPQAWASDDTDAIERLKIQYGSSMCYPISSIGSHVSAIPNHQVHRFAPLNTRANVAYFGTFGYELDLGKLTDEERETVKAQVAFMKQHRQLLQFGTFYRLKSPFEGDGNETVWMVVSEDRREALVGYYRVLNRVGAPYRRVRLAGLDPELCYENHFDGLEQYGDELMQYGLQTTDTSCGITNSVPPCHDFESRIYWLTAK